MARPLPRLIVLVVAALGALGVTLLAASCSSDPVVDEPDLVGVSTVRNLKEVPAASLEAPEVSGPRTIRFRYETGACAAQDIPPLPAAVEATYTIDSVAVTVTPVAPDCDDVEDVASTRGLEVFLDEPIDDRTVTGRLERP